MRERNAKVILKSCNTEIMTSGPLLSLLLVQQEAIIGASHCASGYHQVVHHTSHNP
jgi:hypothetical protein